MSQLQVGQLVFVVGLVQAHQHNGKVGTIEKVLDPSSGRCVVVLDDGLSLNIWSLPGMLGMMVVLDRWRWWWWW